MKVCVYIDQKTQKTVEKSGVGRAVYHQMNALKTAGAKLVSRVEDADVVHINNVFPSSYFAALKAKRLGIPLVYHAHTTKKDFVGSYIGAEFVAAPFGLWLKHCYSLGDVVVCPTDYTKALLRRSGIKKPIISISNGIDLRDYQRNEAAGKEFRKKYGFPESDKVVMSAGWLFKRKGVSDFAGIARRCPEFKFIWFGTGNLRLVGRETRNAVLNKPDNLTFAGYVEKPELQAALSGSDLFLFPSHEENEGIVVLEALAMKTPVLLRRHPVYSDYKKSAMFASDVDEFEKKLRKILSDKELQKRMAEKGYAAVSKKSLERVGEQLNLLLEKEERSSLFP